MISTTIASVYLAYALINFDDRRIDSSLKTSYLSSLEQLEAVYLNTTQDFRVIGKLGSGKTFYDLKRVVTRDGRFKVTCRSATGEKFVPVDGESIWVAAPEASFRIAKQTENGLYSLESNADRHEHEAYKHEILDLAAPSLLPICLMEGARIKDIVNESGFALMSFQRLEQLVQFDFRSTTAFRGIQLGPVNDFT